MIVVRSPYAHARIRSVNLDAARAAEGVVAAFTGADLQDDWKAPMPCAWPVTEDMSQSAALPARCGRGVLPGRRGRGRDRGEPGARARTQPSWSRSTTSRSRGGRRLGGRSQDGAPLAHEGLGTNESYVWKLATEGVDEAFAGADVVVKRRYYQPRLIPNAIEPRAVLARPEPNGDMTMWSATQIPHILTALGVGRCSG